jgi:hypothetical protein
MNINFEIPDIEIISEKKCTELGIQQSSRFTMKHTETFMSKVEEYVLLLGLHCPNMYPIFTSLLVEGKIEVQFKNYIERLVLVQRLENINIRNAFEIFEKTKEVIAWRMNHPETSSEHTQRIIIQNRRNL